MSEIRRLSQPSEVQLRFIDLAEKKASKLLSAHHYVLPTDGDVESILEVHDHGDIISTITRPREPQPTDESPTLVFEYSQVGVIIRDGYFSFSTAGITRGQGSRENLILPQNPRSLVCSSFTDPKSASDELLEREMRKMESVTKGQRIIFSSVFPSHRGKTREEIRRGRSRR